MSNGKPGKQDYDVFSGIPAQFNTDYDDGGWDIGNFQHIARKFDHDLVVFMNSRAFFWCNNWLERFVEAVNLFGPDGLYGVMASYEACPIPGTFPEPNPHIRTSCFVTNPKILRQFPHVVDSREQSFKFESGEWNVSEWYARKGLPVKLVTADGFYERHEWRKPPNIFRRGNQSNCLISDRHTLLYQHASPGEKNMLSNAANGGPRADVVLERSSRLRHKTITVVASTSLAPRSHAEAIKRTVSKIPYPCHKLLISPHHVSGFDGEQVQLPEPWAKNGTWTVDDMCRFTLEGLHAYIKTDVAIIVHHDGYALNKNRWTDEFLDYDFIGAPWPKAFRWHGPGERVGNGGFSLRSKRWLEVATKLPKMPSKTSEDVFACVTHRAHFERAGCKYAPVNVAMRWSFEHPIEEYPKWKLSDSYGFHGRVMEDPKRAHLRLNPKT